MGKQPLAAVFEKKWCQRVLKSETKFYAKKEHGFAHLQQKNQKQTHQVSKVFRGMQEVKNGKQQ